MDPGVLPTNQFNKKLIFIFIETPGTQRSMDSSATPGGASTVSAASATPFRDQLSINPGEGQLMSKKHLLQQFQQLPKPRNEFELAPVGEEDEEDELNKIDQVRKDNKQ